jgi:hypothetical protein
MKLKNHLEYMGSVYLFFILFIGFILLTQCTYSALIKSSLPERDKYTIINERCSGDTNYYEIKDNGTGLEIWLKKDKFDIGSEIGLNVSIKIML